MIAEFSPSPVYDAMAAALAPLSRDGSLPLNVAVKAAAQAVEAEAERTSAVLDSERAKVASLSAAIVSERAEHERSVSAHEAALAAEKAAHANTRTSVETALALAARRIAALENVYVMAAARWNYEGGPAVLREALEACDVR